jgi:hypothetical protein
MCEGWKTSLRNRGVLYDRDFMWMVVLTHIIVIGTSVVLLIFCEIVFWIDVQGIH